MGLLNYITDRLREEGPAAGSLMENYVFTELVKRGLEVKFWRTGTGAEVDFVVNGIPIEVKASVLNNPLLTKSFFSYLETYKPASGFLINSNLYEERDTDGKTVYFYAATGGIAGVSFQVLGSLLVRPTMKMYHRLLRFRPF